MDIVKYKGCKRCGGDLFFERDADGAYISCLQCGAVYVLREKEVPKNGEKVPVRLRAGG